MTNSDFKKTQLHSILNSISLVFLFQNFKISLRKKIKGFIAIFAGVKHREIQAFLLFKFSPIRIVKPRIFLLCSIFEENFIKKIEWSDNDV